jgi:putative transposase
MQKLSTAYSMYFNKRHKRIGPLFQSRFKAEHVSRDEHLKYLFAYIHLNPVKNVDPAWGEKRIADPTKAKNFLKGYQYSSYLDLIGTKRPEGVILSPKDFPGYFSSKVEFEDFVDEWMHDEVAGEKDLSASVEGGDGTEDLMAQFLDH